MTWHWDKVFALVCALVSACYARTCGARLAVCFMIFLVAIS